MGFNGEAQGCSHRDSMRYEEMGGIAFRYCTGCGETHALWQFKDGSFGLIAVPEYSVQMWGQVKGEVEPEEPKPRLVASLTPVVENAPKRRGRKAAEQ